jgi:hypothetical protein
MTIRGLVHSWRALALGAFLLASACDSAGEAQLDAAPPDAVPDTCMGVGTHCTVTGECSGQLECITNGTKGVCEIRHGSCGGILGSQCANQLTCVYVRGTKLGMCVTADELTCMCSHSPADVQGC